NADTSPRTNRHQGLGDRRGERCLYFSFEESQHQIIRNMLSIGIDLERWVKKGQLRFMNSRPTLYGLEMHLVLIHKEVDAFGPSIVVVDPISNLNTSGSDAEVKSMLSRLIDYLKMKQITAVCTDLLPSSGSLERSEIGVSSLMDSWLLLQVLESSGERNRGLYVLKSRGMGHSNQIREFLMSDQGIQLKDVYVGSGGVLTGAARAAQDARERGEILAMTRDFERKKRVIERKKNVIDARILALRTRFEGEMEELDRLAEEIAQGKVSSAAESSELVRLRMADKELPEPGARENGAKRVPS
ncbi:MAG: ATPase domain-containing protein, partial [Spirochaetota bacterium]